MTDRENTGVNHRFLERCGPAPASACPSDHPLPRRYKRLHEGGVREHGNASWLKRVDRKRAQALQEDVPEVWRPGRSAPPRALRKTQRPPQEEVCGRAQAPFLTAYHHLYRRMET